MSDSPTEQVAAHARPLGFPNEAAPITLSVEERLLNLEKVLLDLARAYSTHWEHDHLSGRR